jgi:hypothetical protein
MICQLCKVKEAVAERKVAWRLPEETFIYFKVCEVCVKRDLKGAIRKIQVKQYVDHLMDVLAREKLPTMKGAISEAKS